MRTCDEAGCGKPHHGRGKCSAHYSTWLYQQGGHARDPPFHWLSPEEIRLEAAAVEADVKLPFLVAMFWLTGRELGRVA